MIAESPGFSRGEYVKDPKNFEKWLEIELEMVRTLKPHTLKKERAQLLQLEEAILDIPTFEKEPNDYWQYIEGYDAYVCPYCGEMVKEDDGLPKRCPCCGAVVYI